MSPVTTAPPRPHRLRLEVPVAAPVRPVRRSTRTESVVVFAIAYAVYASIGLYVTLGLGLVLDDAEARLEHAFAVWWNDPQKLAGIGFVWPPLQTVALLAFGGVKPLATSLAALPLTTAAFAAGIVVVANRALRLASLGRPLRLVLVALFGLNPLFVFYAGNGMGEVVYLFFLTLGLFYFVRWSLHGTWTNLPLAGIAFALGILARYEIALWLALVAAAVTALLVHRRASPSRLEGSLIGLLVPGAYAFALWIFLNWLITGRALGFFTAQFPGAAAAENDPATLAARAVALHVAIFPATIVVAAALLVAAVARRSLTAAVLAASLGLNLGTTVFLAVRSHLEVLLQPRYNMRALPLVLVALGWLLATSTPRARRPLALAAAAVLALSIPSTAYVMLEHEPAQGEHAFIVGLWTRESQDGRPRPVGSGVDIGAQREMASFVRDHVRGSDVVLTDDSRTYGVILVDGSPGRYLDRIDHGDDAWFRALRRPYGRVRYLLVEPAATPERDPAFADRVVVEYRELGAGRKPPAFVRLAHRNRIYALYELIAPPHRAVLRRPDSQLWCEAEEHCGNRGGHDR